MAKLAQRAGVIGNPFNPLCGISCEPLYGQFLSLLARNRRGIPEITPHLTLRTGPFDLGRISHIQGEVWRSIGLFQEIFRPFEKHLHTKGKAINAIYAFCRPVSWGGIT